jgi:hypothetical protein
MTIPRRDEANLILKMALKGFSSRPQTLAWPESGIRACR